MQQGHHRSLSMACHNAGLTAAALLLGYLLSNTIAAAAEPNKEALIRDALSAAPPSLVGTATVMDWDHKVLRQGSGPYICHPTLPSLREKGGREPMCLDKVWVEWADAWANKKPFKANQMGIAYMMAGDTGASNTDPYAETQTATNQWVVEGPHIMVIVPDPAQLEGIPTDPNGGGAYVMWKGTPYAHIMIPVGKRPAAKK
jgi:hypothetical protein